MTEQEFTTEELQNERWRDVAGYEGLYSISNLGRVRRDIGGRGLCKTGRILKSSINKRPYLRLVLCKNGKQRTIPVHKLVAAAFIGECPEGMEVNHIKQPKTNNRTENLEYVSHAENMKHAARNGLMNPCRGEKNGSAKLKYSDVMQIFELREKGLSHRKICTIIKISRRQVSRILRSKTTWVNSIRS